MELSWQRTQKKCRKHQKDKMHYNYVELGAEVKKKRGIVCCVRSKSLPCIVNWHKARIFLSLVSPQHSLECMSVERGKTRFVWTHQQTKLQTRCFCVDLCLRSVLFVLRKTGIMRWRKRTHGLEFILYTPSFLSLPLLLSPNLNTYIPTTRFFCHSFFARMLF